MGLSVFTLTDTTVETLTLTATDTTDSIQLAPSIPPTIAFVTPPAASASINASPLSVVNDGMTSTTITVTLKDANGNATPGKLVNISQTGNSVISGPTPQVTDSSGNIQFTATDLVSESVTYTCGGRDRRQLAGPRFDGRGFYRRPQRRLRSRHSSVLLPALSSHRTRPASRPRTLVFSATSISAARECLVSRSTRPGICMRTTK